ncbi:hypothetical protein FDW89_12570 [Citrobacter sp. wls830]|nr:hypothetical protein FDW89_12570 [Citrobacter sp. wls830]
MRHYVAGMIFRRPIPAPDFAGADKRYRFRSKTAIESGGIQIADCYKDKLELLSAKVAHTVTRHYSLIFTLNLLNSISYATLGSYSGYPLFSLSSPHASP